MSLSPGLDVTDLHAGYGEAPVLKGLELSVARGELVVVLGPSGAGKSTLLRVIAGLEPALAGHVRIAGREVTELRPGRRNVSMVFQSYALFPHLTVADNIGFGLTVKDVPRTEVASRVRQAAEAVGCGALLHRRPAQLSGGERQRVALARALVREPEVFLLDEPLSNLDAETRLQTRAELRALHDRMGATMLHVTHDQTEALVLGDRVAVLHDGRIEQIGTPEEIWRRPATRFVARFVGSPAMNLLPADGPVHGPPGHEVGFRPEAVRLDASGDAASARAGAPSPDGAPSPPAASSTAAASSSPAIVERVETVGEDAYVYLRWDGHPVVARVAARSRPEVGARVAVAVPPEDLHLFDAATGQRAP